MVNSKAINSPKDRFRALVHRVITLNRTSTIIASHGAGSEPGINPRHPSANFRYGASVREACEIHVVDYSPVSSSSRSMSNKELVDMLGDPTVSQRPSWSRVRWIDVDGISWDVLKALAIKYNIHPLALENILHTHSKGISSKADYYPQHLFLRLTCLELRDENIVLQPSETQRSALTDEDEDLDSEDFGINNDEIAALQVEVLKQRDRVKVNIFPIFVLLFRDGTILSIHRGTSARLTEPILSRLSRADTLLRTTSDASFLAQSLIDLAVDKTITVTDAYETKLKKFEKQLLMSPKMHTIRNLHILNADLSIHHRNLEPLKQVIYGLRRYDVDRCIALLDLPPGEEKNAKVNGYMSHTSKIYLADVHDHIEYTLGRLDIIYHLGENLIGYSFNLTSYDMNVVMKRLTLVTVICLPLTFLTGYGGMNFANMWWTSKGSGSHTDVWFWIITFPVMIVVMPLFFMSDMKRLYYTMKHKQNSQNALRSYQQSRQGSGSR